MIAPIRRAAFSVTRNGSGRALISAIDDTYVSHRQGHLAPPSGPM
jgi:hypothetical protein